MNCCFKKKKNEISFYGKSATAAFKSTMQHAPVCATFAGVKMIRTRPT